MIVGVGIDIVSVARFEDSMDRSATLRERVFTPAEQALGFHSLAGRWAAKEALAKALGAPTGLVWHDAEIVRGEGGKPEVHVAGTVEARAKELGITNFHVSISHDAGIATAIVIAEAL